MRKVLKQQHYAMSDKHLGAMLAYIQSLPPVDNTPRTTAPG